MVPLGTYQVPLSMEFSRQECRSGLPFPSPGDLPDPGSRSAPGKSGLPARGEGERVMALESREGTRASRRVEEGLSRSFSGCVGKSHFPRLLPETLGNFPGCL